MRGLVDGVAHVIFIETILDTLNAKAAAFEYLEFFEETKIPKLPLMISGTLIDNADRTLSWEAAEAFYISMMNDEPLCIKLNCALVADLMLTIIKRLFKISKIYIHAYYNTGLPNEMEGYDQTTEEKFTELIKDFA